jgi:hypothetical protein
MPGGTWIGGEPPDWRAEVGESLRVRPVAPKSYRVWRHETPGALRYTLYQRPPKGEPVLRSFRKAGNLLDWLQLLGAYGYRPEPENEAVIRQVGEDALQAIAAKPRKE